MSTPYLEIAPPEVGFDAGVACVVPVETIVGLVAPETGDVPDDLAGVAIPGFVGLAVGWEISLGVLLWEKANDQMEKRYEHFITKSFVKEEINWSLIKVFSAKYACIYLKSSTYPDTKVGSILKISSS